MSAMIFLAATAMTSVAASDVTVKETVYTATIGEDVRFICEKLGVAAPERRLVLRSDSTCELVTGDSRRSGRYTMSDNALGILFDKSADVSIATISGERILLNGVAYQAAPTFGPGVWTVRRSNGEDATMRFTFEPRGKFAFEGMGVSSKGTWTLDGGALVLLWSEIDGLPVEKGSSISKRIALKPSGFDIDQYHYERRS